MTSDAKVKNSHPHHFNHLISSHSQWHSKECIRSVNKTNDVVLFLFTPIAHHRKQYEYAWDCVRVCVCVYALEYEWYSIIIISIHLCENVMFTYLYKNGRQ